MKNWMLTSLLTSAFVLGGAVACDSEAPSSGGDGDEASSGDGDDGEDMPDDGDGDQDVPGDEDGVGGSSSLGGSGGVGGMGGSLEFGLGGNSAATLSTRLGTCESRSLERTIDIPEGVIVMWFEVSGTNTNGMTESWLSLGDWIMDLPEVEGTTEVVPACLPSDYAGSRRLARFVLRSTGDCGENAIHIDNIRFGSEKIKCDRFAPND